MLVTGIVNLHERSRQVNKSISLTEINLKTNIYLCYQKVIKKSIYKVLKSIMHFCSESPKEKTDTMDILIAGDVTLSTLS